MKGMVGVAIALLALGVIYVLVRRPSVQPKNITGPSTSNQIFGVLGSIGGNIVNAFASSGSNKVAPPSAQPIVNEGTYDQGPAHIEGNQLIDDSGQALTYGTD